MSAITYAFTVVMAINVMLFLGQIAVLETNTEAPIFHDCQGSLLGSFETGNCSAGNYILDDSDPTSRLASGETSISPETGNIFTDAFTALKSWFLESTGLSYLVQILSAPYNFLKALMLPEAFVFAVGTLWYGVTLLLIILVLIGRDD